MWGSVCSLFIGECFIWYVGVIVEWFGFWRLFGGVSLCCRWNRI